MDLVSDGTYYGKHRVRILQHFRHGNTHNIKEVAVNTHLSLARQRDYLHGDNSDVIATDSQKNTVYALAKTKGIRTPEQFAMDLSRHFLTTYEQVVRTEISVEEAPWHRMDHSGKEHVHAFIHRQEAKRFCIVQQEKNGLPKVSSGLSDMKVLKTTKSGFVGFVRDRFTSLPETTDRILCTSVRGKWSYSSVAGIDFDKTWEICKNTILDIFAGPPETGMYSPSVQQTLYQAAQQIMAKVPQVDKVELEMPNIHYLFADLKKIGMENSGDILVPTDEPRGYIRAAVCRTTARL
ncbi:uricase-like isoform X2 [Acanthaster planci]|nr:uricase-like isoform X2 [Acanthaster planci]XP_022094665.1 uricase-like isoform X2 [Acanthaster planci]